MRNGIWAAAILSGFVFTAPAGAAARQAVGNAFLGIQFAPLTPEMTTRLGVAIGNGAVIVSVVPNSPAAAAGLKPDQVVMGIDGQTVTRPEDILATVARHASGDSIGLMVLDTSRGFNQRNISVTLGQRGAAAAASPSPNRAPPPRALPNNAPAASAGNGAAAGGVLVATQPLRNQFCRALAPAGWNIIDQDARGATFTVASPDRRLIAAYGIVAISAGQRSGFYGQQFTSPQAFAPFMASAIIGQDVQAGGTQNFNGMQVTNFRAANQQGFVIYRIYPLAGDPGGFTISARIAIGANAADVPVAGAIAAGVECNTTFKAPPGGYAVVRAKPAETGTSRRCKAGDCNDSDLAGTYNAQLGTGYVHSKSGTNYLVDPARDYRDTGPDGPGYYRQNGNFLEKLEPGRAD